MKVRKGDNILVISGEYKGKRGKVMRVFPQTNRVLVEGINIVKKHTKATREAPQGGIVESPAPISASNVMLICSKCNKATRVRSQIRENGEKVRICKYCGKEVS